MSRNESKAVAEQAWERVEDDHLREALRLSFQERLKWLEEAAQVAATLSSPHPNPPQRDASGRLTSS